MKHEVRQTRLRERQSPRQPASREAPLEAITNEQPLLCELPKVKCAECPNQAFIPCDDAAVIGRLAGRHVMGVYPLLAPPGPTIL